MQYITEVQINKAGDANWYLTHGLKLMAGDMVIVEGDRGLDNGTVLVPPREMEENERRTRSYRKVIRKVNPWDEKQIGKNAQKRSDLMKICRQKIDGHGLPMKLVDAEYAFDRSRILFYFTSEKRVDFRQLVKDLASIFRVRIELRQVGVRDEAKMIGGCGPCGRQLCCGSFLSDFEPVTIKMAKLQDLSLNPAKISGCCGRLMCCLAFEHEVYKKALRDMPRAGKKVRTSDGLGKVLSVKPLCRRVTVELSGGRVKEMSVEDMKEVKQRS